MLAEASRVYQRLIGQAARCIGDQLRSLVNVVLQLSSRLKSPHLSIPSPLKEQFGVDVPRRKIVLPDDVKHLGEYEATLNLHPEVVTQLAFEVVAE